jgi:hypothetical protein
MKVKTEEYSLEAVQKMIWEEVGYFREGKTNRVRLNAVTNAAAKILVAAALDGATDHKLLLPDAKGQNKIAPN